MGTLAYASSGAGSGCGSGASVVVVGGNVVVVGGNVVVVTGATVRALALSSRVTTRAVAPAPTASTEPITTPTSVRRRRAGLIVPSRSPGPHPYPFPGVYSQLRHAQLPHSQAQLREHLLDVRLDRRPGLDLGDGPIR